MPAKPLSEWPDDAQVRYHEVMGKLTEWMAEQEADVVARRRVRDEVKQGRLETCD